MTPRPLRPVPSGRNQVEHATLLTRQGDGAVALFTEGGGRSTEAAGLTLLAGARRQRASGWTQR